MNKTLLLIAIGALAVIYLAYSEKTQTNQPEELKTKPQPQLKQHHLTKAFANAKKHAVK